MEHWELVWRVLTVVAPVLVGVVSFTVLILKVRNPILEIQLLVDA